MYKSIGDWQEFVGKSEPLTNDSDDIRMLNDFAGWGNWGFVVESLFITKDNLVVCKGQLSISLTNEEKKKGKKNEIEEPIAFGLLELKAYGAGIVNLSVGFQSTALNAIRRARHAALGALGMTIEEDASGDKMPTSSYYGYNKASASKEDKPIAKKKKEGDPDADECASCGEEIKGYKTNAGKWMNPGQVKKMTFKSYGENLCMDCNIERFKEEKGR